MSQIYGGDNSNQNIKKPVCERYLARLDERLGVIRSPAPSAEWWDRIYRWPRGSRIPSLCSDFIECAPNIITLLHFHRLLLAFHYSPPWDFAWIFEYSTKACTATFLRNQQAKHRNQLEPVVASGSNTKPDSMVGLILNGPDGYRLGQSDQSAELSANDICVSHRCG